LTSYRDRPAGPGG